MTIQCAERGLLLNRVRGELRSLIKTHRRLYESSAAFGVRKMLLTEANKESRLSLAKEISAANEELQKQIQDAQAQLQELKDRHQQKLQAVRKYIHIDS